MRYQYHDLYDKKFEELVVSISSKVLGPAVQPFSTGPDGGRDARFEGNAIHFPLSGTFVIQAKHTEHPFAKFSDSNFSGDGSSSILSKEVPRIARLKKQNDLDHYFLFSNRRIAGEADAKIRKQLEAETGVNSIHLFGIERIDLLLKTYPAVLDIVNISEVNAPLRVTSDDLSEVIVAFAKHCDAFSEAWDNRYEIKPRTSFNRKNEINHLSSDFSKLIQRDYLSDFQKVHKFLANPINEKILERYQEAATELREQILAHKDEYSDLDKILVSLQYQLFQRDRELAQKNRLTKLVLYYMYWFCDIGENEN